MQGSRVLVLRGAAGLLCVLLVAQVTSTAGECGVLGHAGRSFRASIDGSSCVVCGDDASGAPCSAPSATVDAASACYGIPAHPTNMALRGDEDTEVHRIPGCACHASCAKCGYADMPTAETNCIECADPAATLVRTDDWELYRTGSCEIPLVEGAARCQLTLDTDFASLGVNFNAELKTDMAAIMAIRARRIDILSVAPGSTVVIFDVYPSDDESGSATAEAIQLLQTTVVQGSPGAFAGFSAVSFEIVALPDEPEDGSTSLLDQEVVLSMVEILLYGGSIVGVLLMIICILVLRVVCCRRAQGVEKYDAPISNKLDLEQGGSHNNSPASSPKSPAAIRREREAAARAAAQLDHVGRDEDTEEEEEDQLSPLDTDSYRNNFVETPSHRNEGRARSSSVSSSSVRSKSHRESRSRSGSLSSGGSGRHSRSGSISSGGSHRSRSGSISGSSSPHTRSRSISGSSGRKSLRSSSISSGGMERSHSDGRRRSVSSKKPHRSLSLAHSNSEIDPRDDMNRAAREHEAAMAAAAAAEAAELDSPPGSVPRSPSARSPSHRTRGGDHSSSSRDSRRQSVSRSSRSHSRRRIETEERSSSED